MDKEKVKRFNLLMGELLNKKSDLWIKVAHLGRTIDYCQIKEPVEKIKAELDLIEKEIGYTPEIEEAKALASSLFPREPQQAATRSETSV